MLLTSRRQHSCTSSPSIRRPLHPLHPPRIAPQQYVCTQPHSRALQEVLGSFGCEAVTAAAEQLREIVNLYVVPPENLPSLMEQGMLAEMGTEVGCFSTTARTL